MERPPFTIVFAGGGSGGHVYPTLAVFEALIKRFSEIGLRFRAIRMGPRDGYDPLFANHGAIIAPIAAGKVRRYASLANLIDIPKFFIGFLQALWKLYFIMPEVIFSKGGVGALPVVVAGWFYRIPVVLHESDAQPGVNNLTSARFAKKVFVSFERAAKFFDAKKVAVVGTPLRTELFAERTAKPLAKETLGFDASSPLTLVLGGSQGSSRINNFILTQAQDMLAATQILHQTGVANLAEVQKLAHAATFDESFKTRYQAVGYFLNNGRDTMGLALAAADLVIARAGSGSIAEISAFGIPAILIPLAESANDHQRINAYEFAKGGGAVVIEEANLLPGIFMGEIKKFFGDEAVRAKMSEASAKFFIPGAAEAIAQELIAQGTG